MLKLPDLHQKARPVKQTPLRMETSHITPNQHLALLLRRQARQDLLNRRRLRGKQSIVLRRPCWNVGKEVAVQFSFALGGLGGGGLVGGSGGGVAGGGEGWGRWECLAYGTAEGFAGVASLVAEEVVDGGDL